MSIGLLELLGGEHVREWTELLLIEKHGERVRILVVILVQVVVKQPVTVSLQIDLNASVAPSVLGARLWRLAGRRGGIGEVRLHDLELVVDMEWLEVVGCEELRLVEEWEGGLLGGRHAVGHFCRVETLNAV